MTDIPPNNDPSSTDPSGTPPPVPQGGDLPPKIEVPPVARPVETPGTPPPLEAAPTDFAAYPRYVYQTPATLALDMNDIGAAFKLITAEPLLWALNGLIYAVPILASFGVYFFVILGSTAAAATNSSAFTMLFGGQLLAGFAFVLFNGFWTFLWAAGTQRMALRQIDGKPLDWSYVFSFDDRLLPALIGAFLFGATVGVLNMFCSCMQILLLPLGIYAWPLIVEKKMDPIEAIKRSFAICGPNYGANLLVTFVSSLAAGLGALACGVGILFTAPLMPIVYAIGYRKYYPAEPTETPSTV